MNSRKNTSLHFAYEKSNKNMIMLLKSYNAQLLRNLKNLLPGERRLLKEENSLAKLIEAVKSNDINLVYERIYEGSDINGKDKCGSTPLMHAVNWTSFIDLEPKIWCYEKSHCARGWYKCKNLVIIKSCNYRGNTALHFAYEVGDQNLVDYLLDHGAKLIRNCEDNYPGDEHQFYELEELPNLVLINTIKTGNGKRYFYCKIGAKIDFLLKRGVDVNEFDAIGNTPLHYAAYMGRIDIVMSLIESGALIEVFD